MLKKAFIGIVISVAAVGMVNAQGDGTGRGTHVAGTIGAYGNNAVGLEGGGGRDILIGGLGVDRSQVQPGGIQVLLLDGSVRSVLNVKAVFPLARAPRTVRMAIGELWAPTMEGCLANTDFSAARPMDPRGYRTFYDPATESQILHFNVERETTADGSMFRPTCHVVRFAGDYDNDSRVDGRDFLVWQRGGSPNASLGDGSVRFVRYQVSNGY